MQWKHCLLYPEPLPSYLRDEACGDCFFESSDHHSNQNCSDEHDDLEVPWLKFVFFFFPWWLKLPPSAFSIVTKVLFISLLNP